MNKKQIESYKEQLEKNKASLESMLQRFAKKDTLPEDDWDTIYPKTEGSNMEEMADEVEEFSSLIKIEHSLEVKLKNINDALRKIKKGTYGICEKCNQEIEQKKLSVIPETKVCKKCQK